MKILSTLSKDLSLYERIKRKIYRLFSNKVIWRPDYVVANIEVTNYCNLACTTCVNPILKRKKGLMTMDIFQKSLEVCKDDNIQKVKLYMHGEPFVHPEYMEMLKMACFKNFPSVSTSTNGMLLNEKIIDELLDIGISKIQYSFSGWDQESYEKVYKKGSFDKAIENITLINKKIKQKNLPLTTLDVNGLANKDDLKTIQHCEEFLLRLELDPTQFRIHSPGNFGGYVSTKNKRIDLHNLPTYCGKLDKRVGVYWDGNITACGCSDPNGELIIGHINKDRFSSLRRSEKYQRLVRCFEKRELNKIPICYNCRSLPPAL